MATYSRLLILQSPLMYGDDISAVQSKLNSVGYNCGAVDGYYGNLTYNAVVAFQRNNSLDVDGIVGPNTWNNLFAQNCNGGLMWSLSTTGLMKPFSTNFSRVGQSISISIPGNPTITGTAKLEYQISINPGQLISISNGGQASYSQALGYGLRSSVSVDLVTRAISSLGISGQSNGLYYSVTYLGGTSYKIMLATPVVINSCKVWQKLELTIVYTSYGPSNPVPVTSKAYENLAIAGVLILSVVALCLVIGATGGVGGLGAAAMCLA